MSIGSSNSPEDLFESGNPFSVLLTSGGDVLAARACAQMLLNRLAGPPSRLDAARLLLTAVCLQLYPVAGPDPTLADLYDFLTQLGPSDSPVRDALAESPLALVRYVAEELDAGYGSGSQAILTLAIEAVSATMRSALW